jgi:hypothetical protein
MHARFSIPLSTIYGCFECVCTQILRPSSRSRWNMAPTYVEDYLVILDMTSPSRLVVNLRFD